MLQKTGYFYVTLTFYMRLIAGILSSGDFDNEIIGLPEVVCERDQIKFSVPTKKPFRGRVYVKGEYGNEQCIRHYGGSHDSYTSRHYGHGTSQGGGFSSSGSEFERHRSSYTNENRVNTEFGARGGSVYGGRDRYDFGPDAGSDDSRGDGSISGSATDHFEGSSSGYKNKIHQENSAFRERNGFQVFDRSGAGSRNLLPTGDSLRPGSEGGFAGASERERSSGGAGGSSASEFWKYTSEKSRFQSGSGQDCPLVCPPCDLCNDFRHKRQSQSSANLDVRIDTCSARRDRSQSPPGVHISFTIVVSFHDSFITKLDRAYHIACSYEEIDRTVSTEIDVSMQPTTELTGFIEPPKCEYGIFDLRTGMPVNNVMVGDQIRHEWRCHSTNPNTQETYGMLVHACYIEDGKGQRHMVIDERGCSIPIYDVVISTPRYASDSLSASIESIVVKFPDRTYLDFQCSIQVCVKSEGECEGITPPNCGIKRLRRELSERLNDTRKDWKIYAKRLTVLDLDENIDKEGFESMDHSTFNSQMTDTISNDFCVSIAGFGVLVSASTFLVTIMSTALIAMIIMRNQKMRE